MLAHRKENARERLCFGFGIDGLSQSSTVAQRKARVVKGII